MENIKMEVESKFWNENGMWCVAVRLPEDGHWSDSCWDKSREKAEEKVMKIVKKHIDFEREMKKSAEKREEVLVY
jgi:hypothetical protein